MKNRFLLFSAIVSLLVIVSCEKESGTVAVTSLTISPPSLVIKKGEEIDLSVTISPEDATYKTVNWKSTDSNIVSVNSSGHICALSEGRAIITASSGSVFASCSITVKDVISFADYWVKSSLLSSCDSDHDGEISYEEAASAKSIEGVFNWSGGIETYSFDEFQYFTGIKELPDFVFKNLPWRSVTLPNSIVRIGKGAFLGCNRLEKIAIPNSVKYIDASAFEWCENLKSISIGNSVVEIGKYAFAECYSLDKIIIPDSVRLIGTNAFIMCKSLSSIKLSESITSIPIGMCHDCAKLETISIPESVVLIDEAAFYRCNSLKSVSIPATSSLSTIGLSAFSGCSSLSSILLPASVSSIGSMAFSGCSLLESIVIPNSVIILETFLFRDCKCLTSVTLPEYVSEIEDGAFFQCSSLGNVTVKAILPPKGYWGMFNSCPCSIFVPSDSIEKYKKAEFWSDYSDRIQAIPE